MSRPSSSPSMCMLPWVHLHTWPNGNTYPCCLTPMEHVSGNLNENTLEEIFNGEQQKKLRLEMLDGKKPESCIRCWKQEDDGGHSMRHRANKSWSHYKDIIATTQPDGSVPEFKLPYWDFRFSNICNFKCRSCGPQLSSGWYGDTKKIALIETGRSFLPDDVPKERNYDLWEQVLPHFQYVEEIYFAGGEPLIMEEHYRILKELDRLGMHHVLIRYNTNFSEMRYKDLNVLDFWPKFKNIEIGCSVDGMHEQGEFIRSGFKWDQFVENRIKMKEKNSHAHFYVSCTTSIQNSFHIIPFHHELVRLGLIDDYDKFFVNIVTEPMHLDMRILPKKYKRVLSEKYQQHIDFLDGGNRAPNASQGFKSLKTHMEQDFKEDTEWFLNEFVYRMQMLDKMRNENFVEVFDELRDMYYWQEIIDE